MAMAMLTSGGWLLAAGIGLAPAVPEPVATEEPAIELAGPGSTEPEPSEPEGGALASPQRPAEGEGPSSGEGATVPPEPEPSEPEPAEPAEPSPEPPTTYDPTLDLPVAYDDEVPPRAASDDDDADDDGLDRRGFFFTLGTGLGHCAQDFCSPIPMGGVGRLELGVRLTRLALVGSVVGGGGLADPDESGDRAIRFLSAGAGLQWLPVREGRVDPFLGATIGYSRVARLEDPDSTRDRQYASRAAVRLSGGIAWILGRRVTLGPRFDVELPFGGRWCTAFADDSGSEDDCSSIGDDILGPIEDDLDRRRQRRSFPRPWALTLDLRVTI